MAKKYTCNEILHTLRSMQVTPLSKESGYIPSYKRTALTDDLSKASGFCTDYEFISKSAMRSIIKSRKAEEIKNSMNPIQRDIRHNSIDVYANAGYFLRIDCNKVEVGWRKRCNY